MVKYEGEIPDYGDLMTVEDFVSNCESGVFIDYDGHGYPCKDGKCYQGFVICPSSRRFIPSDATHIVWFNR